MPITITVQNISQPYCHMTSLCASLFQRIFQHLKNKNVQSYIAPYIEGIVHPKLKIMS